MCGIAGIICEHPETRIGEMLRAIEHRGRDDEGVYISQGAGPCGGIALGHRRLSILDTSPSGHQPMSTGDGRFHITFNGEIYNFKDVRAELESVGEIFATESDTEVLLKAFRRWNVRCLERLNGMFAFAVWDDVDKELTLVRDRAGIKPLFYAENDGSFVFGSEIKAILASGLIQARLDLEALDQVLTFLWPVPPNTLFTAVFQLLPGHYLKWKDGKIKTAEWWDLDYSVEQEMRHEAEWIERSFEVLDRVIGMEMVSDVPLGAFLSGGVDSSLIVALMCGHTSKKVTTYTAGMSTEDLKYDIIPDDLEWSRKMPGLYSIDYHESILNPDVCGLLPKLVRAQEAPIIDMAIPSYLISEQARTHQKVMLSGMGGDEIFAGYPRHLAMRLASWTDRVPGSIRRPAMHAIHSVLPGGRPGRLTSPLRNIKKFSKSAALDLEHRYLGFGTYFTGAAKSALFSEPVKREAANFDPYKLHRSYFEKAKNFSELNKLLYVDFKTFMPALNLDTTDRTSMAANLEVRVPYLNNELVKLTAEMPSSLKIKGFKRKYALKRAAERRLPKEMIWRKKSGFGAPIRSWLRGPLIEMVNDLLSDSRINKRGLFEAAAVRKLVGDNLAGREDLNLQVLCLLTLELWMQEFIDA